MADNSGKDRARSFRHCRAQASKEAFRWNFCVGISGVVGGRVAKIPRTRYPVSDHQHISVEMFDALFRSAPALRSPCARKGDRVEAIRIESCCSALRRYCRQFSLGPGKDSLRGT